MRFVLEEVSWLWNGEDRDGYVERLELLLDRLDVAWERAESYVASRELLAQKVLDSFTLADLLWGDVSPLQLPPDVSQRVTAVFHRMEYWDDLTDWPALESEIDGERVDCSSAVIAHARVGTRNAVACLPLPGKWSGPLVVVVDGRSERVHFVVDERTHRAFFRDALEVERIDASGLPALAPHAFPDLLFLPDVWDGIRHFQGGYARVRDDLLRLLAVLDEQGAWVFTDETGRLSREESSSDEHRPVTNDVIKARFKKWGLDMAPEKPNVWNDRPCRHARERTLGVETLYCEWHYKFEPHVNRVHIHPPVAGSGGRVVVAIFRDHLPLPNDS